MSGPSGEECSHCYYFQPDGEEVVGFGFCHRYPPKIHTTLIYLKDDKDEAGFPEPVSDGQWCGEFKPNPTKAAKDLPADDALLYGLPLSTRVLQCFKNYDMIYVRDVRYLPDRALLRTPNLGRKSLRLVREVIGPYIEAGA